MTYRKFARLHGITPGWLCNILSGANPSDELATKLSKSTGRPLSVFFGPKEGRRAAVEKYLKNN